MDGLILMVEIPSVGNLSRIIRGKTDRIVLKILGSEVLGFGLTKLFFW